MQYVKDMLATGLSGLGGMIGPLIGGILGGGGDDEESQVEKAAKRKKVAVYL